MTATQTRQSIAKALLAKGFTHLGFHMYQLKLPNGGAVGVDILVDTARVITYPPIGNGTPEAAKTLKVWHPLADVPALIQQGIAKVSAM